MKTMLLRLIALTLISVSATSFAEIDLEEVTINVEESRPERSQQRPERGDNLILKYMLEQGDITAQELEARNAKREAIRAELSGLKEAGDREALQAKIEVLRQERESERDEMRLYVDAHPELAQALSLQREQLPQADFAAQPPEPQWQERPPPSDEFHPPRDDQRQHHEELREERKEEQQRQKEEQDEHKGERPNHQGRW